MRVLKTQQQCFFRLSLHLKGQHPWSQEGVSFPGLLFGLRVGSRRRDDGETGITKSLLFVRKNKMFCKTFPVFSLLFVCMCA